MLYKQVEGGTQAGKSIRHGGKCNVCDAEEQKVLYNARLPVLGAWAWLCESCFETHKCQLGVGSGQKYMKEED